MTWELILCASIIAQALASIFNRVFMRDAGKNTWAYSALSQMLTGALIGVYAVIHGFSMPPLLDLWPWFLAVVVLNVATNYVQFEALRTAEVSLYTILTSVRILVSIVAAALLLGEHVTLRSLVGAIMMLAAIAIAFTDHFRFEYRRWMGYALLYALSSGLIFIFDARIVGVSDVASYMALAFFIPGLATILYKPSILPDMQRLALSPQIKPMFFYSAAYGVMALTLWLAYQLGGTASEIAPLRQSAVILTVIFALVFLGERTRVPQKILAGILAIIAVYFIV